MRLFLIASLLVAQDATIRVTTRLVQVNVVVRDSHGPIAGLTQKDFKIFDKGKERPIALFSVSSVSKAAAKATPPPGVYTNRMPARDEPAATVLLIDVLNTEVADQQTALQQLHKFLASLDPNRRVAIYVLGRSLRVIQDFTDDPALLKKAAARVKGEPSTLLAGATVLNPGDPPGSTEDLGIKEADGPTLAMREALAEMRDAANIDRVNLTLAALEQIAHHLSHAPGRKTLIWISGSFPLYLMNDERHNFMAANRENRTFQQEINHTNRVLSAADVAIYPVDARGLLGFPDFDVRQPGNGIINPQKGRSFGTRGNGQLGAMSVDTPEGLDSMQALADGTGGRAFYNTNDIKGAIGKAIADADVTYTLGFYITETDGAFHDLKVKVDRAGADVRHRKGYVAEAQKAAAESEVGAILRSTAADSLDSTAIGLIAALDHSRLALHIDLNDLSLEKVNGKWTGALDVAYISLSEDGRNLGLASKKISLDLTDEVYTAKRREGLTLEQTIEPAKGLARIRVVVLDERSGVTGSLTVRN